MLKKWDGKQFSDANYSPAENAKYAKNDFLMSLNPLMV